MHVDYTSRTIATALICGLIFRAKAALFETVIDTRFGSIQGYPAFNVTPAGNLSKWENITVWKGIPFAATTGGQNRWKAPQPLSPWNGTFNADQWGPVCPSAVDGDTYIIDEDCLNLNIWSAANSSDAKLPVVIWSYPAYSTAADALFDGGGMADKGVVYVNYNYRTGSFGWLAHPELSAEFEAVTGSNSSGNWGMLDQFAAVKWVHENIAAFGGDPHHITVMGQSAGSAATQHILNSNLTKGLIVGAIIESGVRVPHDPLASSLAENYKTLDWALSQGVNYTLSKNVSTIAELREISTDDLTEALLGSEWDFTATLDYYAMPDTYLNTLKNRLANDVPIITGNTKDESGATYGLNITIEEYMADLNTTYTDDFIQDFLTLYPANNSAQASGAWNSQFTDRSKVGTWMWAQLWAEVYDSPVYTYLWDHAPPSQTSGAYHESEINYVLNNLYATTDKAWTSQDYEIAGTMNAYWVNFIKSGNPNGGNLAHWPVTSTKQIVQEVGNGWGSIRIASKEKVSLFRSWFQTLPAF